MVHLYPWFWFQFVWKFITFGSSLKFTMDCLEEHCFTIGNPTYIFAMLQNKAYAHRKTISYPSSEAPTKIPPSRSSFSYYLTPMIPVDKTQLRSAKRWQCITRLINKSETTVMVSRLIPHRSSNILLCSYFFPSSVNYLSCSYSCPSSVDSFTVFSSPSVFRWFIV